MKKIFLILGYIAGVLVGTKYGDKVLSKGTKKTVKKGKESLKDQAIEAGKEMLETHKSAFAELKKEYWTAENKKLVLSKKKDLEKFFALAKAELAEAGEVLKKHGVDTDAIGEKIESIYTEKKGLIEKLGKTPAAKAAKRKLSTLVTKIKKSI
ncbi:hypothetical protein KA050_01685 [Candidatus Gracilibacteria bacterium]|nr:hypothetical protein [Candidatus Gracilibacteria bacterium]